MTEPSDRGLIVTINSGDFDGCPTDLLERGVLAALRHENLEEAEVSITLLDDGDIRALNAEYLQHDRPTDVIAFSLDGPGGVLGDVYIGCEQAQRQAVEADEDVGVELLRLAIHGSLHVLGYDHPQGPERVESPMFALQERLVGDVLNPS